jgi:outer membrane protein OmpA-like peptidoglycan-associated protein
MDIEGGELMSSWIKIVALSLLFTPGFAGANQDVSEARDELKAFSQANSSNDLEFSINGSRRDEWRVGESIKFHVSTREACDMAAILIDSSGVGTLINLGEISAGEQRKFPEGPNFMNVQPPLGTDDLYVFCAKSLPDVAIIGVPIKENVIEAEDVDRFVNAYISAVEGNVISSKHLQFKIKGRDDEVAMTSNDIVAFFTTRSRTIARPKLPLQVNFAFGSVEISSADAKMLDEMAGAMQHAKMDGAQFELGGHTDDVGTEPSNFSLSGRRASAVKSYLSTVHNIENSKINTVPYGESKPVESNTDDEGRAINRRVEFKLIQDF